MKTFKTYFPIVTYAILLFLGFSNLDKVIAVLGHLLSVLMPLIIGIAIAFVLNLLLRMIESDHILNNKRLRSIHFVSKNMRAIGIMLTYTVTITVFVLMFIFIVPQVIDSSKTLIDKLPEYGRQITDFGTRVYNDLGLSEAIISEWFGNFKDIFVGLSEFTASTLITLFNVTKDVTSGALNLFLGTIFSVYLLAQKEKLIETASKINRAFNREDIAEGFESLGKETSHIFSRFVGGQLTEAMILGTLCFIGLILFKIPYAPLVSVLVGITSLIPIVGAFIGIVPSFLIIAMESPTQALLFLVFILILQQFEGNFIYPKVVGNAIGISGFWVFLAIIVGGGLFGILGMLLGVPLMAVAYTILRRVVNNRLKEKQM
ncbi:MAG TPA: AI-2E family transporter [Clostridiales bacterium UBA8960]|jgi:predicted PurR-regulated permease PerM|nr:AI-2E family transporter [Clostridiales bacterium UBA8960]